MSAMAERRVEPEWLDTLPPDDPRAQRSRRDLRALNALMGNAAIVARRTARTRDAFGAIAGELGAGDGAFAARLARALPPRGGRRDAHVGRPAGRRRSARRSRASRRAAGRRARRRADVFDWLERTAPAHDAIVANLFLHHFEGDALARMLALVARAHALFVACEPRRAAFALPARASGRRSAATP